MTLSLWAARHPFAASALVLNSPWLEFQATELGRRVISPLIGLEAQLRPLAPRALSLGSTVTVARIADAMHDVFLSAAPVRGRAYAAIDRWRGGYGPAARRMLRGPSTLRRRRRA